MSNTRMRIQFTGPNAAEAARKLAALTPEDLQKLSEAAGVPIRSISLVEDEGEAERRTR